MWYLSGKSAAVSFGINSFTMLETSFVPVHTHMQPCGEGEILCQEHETNNFISSTDIQNAWIFTTMPLKLSVASYLSGKKERIGVECIMGSDIIVSPQLTEN
jgi:hypothetical protein